MEAILAAVRDAAKLCRRVQMDYLKANVKGEEPVTIADYGSQAVIGRALQRHCPDDGVIAEESGRQFLTLVPAEERAAVLGILADVLGQSVSEAEVVDWLDFGRGRPSRRTWVIDPIDGTRGFIARRHYAIACGLLVDGRPAEGIVAAPGYDESGALFYTRDGSVWRAPLAGGMGEKVTVSRRRGAHELVAAQSFEKRHASKSRMRRARELAGLGDARVRELDSMEKYALVACGDADLYMRLPLAGLSYAHKIWDHAAGTELVIQAGGRVTDLDGSPLDFSQGDALPNIGMIVSSGQHHDRIIAAVQKAMDE